MTGYFDGASRGNPGEAGAGAVLFDNDGKEIWSCARYLGAKTNNEAEYAALILLLEEARQRGIKELEIMGDSNLVVKQVSKEWKINFPHLRELAKNAWSLMEGSDIKLRWVPRAENRRADELSNIAIDEK